MSPGRPGERASETGGERGSRRGLTARLLCRRCWCRSWSSIRSVRRPRVPVPASPSRPASRPWWSPGRLSCLFPAVAEEVGLGGKRAQQELRGIGEQLPRPPRARVPSRVSASVRAPRGRARGVIHGGRAARTTGPTPEGSRWRGGGGFGRKRSWGRRRAQAGAPLARGRAGAPGATASHSEGRSHRSPFRLVTRALIGLCFSAPPKPSDHLFPRNRVLSLRSGETAPYSCPLSSQDRTKFHLVVIYASAIPLLPPTGALSVDCLRKLAHT